MPLYKLGALINLVGLIWYVWHAWKNDHKILAGIAFGYLFGALMISTGQTHNAFVLYGTFLLFIAVCTGSIINIGTMWMPLALVVGGSLMFYKLRPGPETTTVEDQQLFDEGSPVKTFTPN